MSYHFDVSEPSRAMAKQQVAQALERIARDQAAHQADFAQARRAAESFIDVCPEPGEGEAILVTMSGSVGWRGEQTSTIQVRSASVSISVATITKPR